MPASAQAINQTVEVDGSALPDDVVAQLESAVVTQRTAMPDTVSIAFRDPRRDVLGRAGIEIGKGLKVSVGSVRDDSPTVLFDGEVTAIEAEYDSIGARAVVRAFDRSHKLMAGCKTATFKNMKYSDIATQLANDASLTPDVDETSGVQEHVIQNNESDLDFLYRLARLANRVVQVEGTTLHFKEPTPSDTGPGAGDSSGTDPTQLWFGADLLEFRARISAVAQAANVEVRGWDPEQKQAVIGKADVTASHASVSMSASDLADKAGGRTHTVTDLPVLKQEDADALASARSEQIGSAGFEAFALTVGSPALRPGTAVSINGVDPALVGKWTIAAARQEFGNGPYRTHLDLVGLHDRSISGLLSKGGGAGGGDRANRVPGVAIGIVSDNDDPQKRGRVKVQLPWLSDDAETWWARVAAPGAGPSYGMVWVPQVGDEVLVAFDHGSIDHPYVLGGLWNGQDEAPLGDDLFDNGDVKRVGFVSRKGHQLIFFDDDSESGIALISSDNKFRISMNETKGTLHIFADGDLKVETKKDFEIKTDGDFKVKARNVKVEADSQTSIKGQSIALN